MEEIRAKVTTGASRESVTEGKDGRLLIAVSAPRKDGRATMRARELIAQHLAVAPEQVRLIRGKDQASKTFRIEKRET